MTLPQIAALMAACLSSFAIVYVLARFRRSLHEDDRRLLSRLSGAESDLATLEQLLTSLSKRLDELEGKQLKDHNYLKEVDERSRTSFAAIGRIDKTIKALQVTFDWKQIKAATHAPIRKPRPTTQSPSSHSDKEHKESL